MDIGSSMMIVQHDDRQHNRRRYHKHDAIEICACVVYHCSRIVPLRVVMFEMCVEFPFPGIVIIINIVVIIKRVYVFRVQTQNHKNTACVYLSD